MQISRRNFLRVLGFSAVGATAAGTLRWIMDPRERYIISVLKRKLPYANFDDALALEFAQELIANDTSMASFQGKALAFVGASMSPTFARIMGNRIETKIMGKEERIAGQFLLSTDFFELNNKTNTLTYFGLNDPYVMGCANPLATLA